MPKGKVWAIAIIVTTKEGKLTKIQTRKWFVIVRELTPKYRSDEDMEHTSSRDRKVLRRSNDPARVQTSQPTTTRSL
jgi:hypothetical protein